MGYLLGYRASIPRGPAHFWKRSNATDWGCSSQVDSPIETIRFLQLIAARSTRETYYENLAKHEKRQSNRAG
jgi:hypothetical protein